MNLQEHLSFKGIFNPAGEPENQLTGELTFSHQEGIDVTLLGSFDKNQLVGSKLGLYHGFSTAGKKMTLVDSSLSLRSVNMPGIMQSGIHARYLLLGDWFSSQELLTFDSFRFSCKDLNHWLNISGFQKPVYDRNLYEVVIKYKKPETKIFSINEDFDLHIEFDYYGPSEYFTPSEKITVEQKPYFKIISKKEKQHFDKFLKCYQSILSFLSICYFGFPATIECILQRNGTDEEKEPLYDIEVFYGSGINFEKYVPHRDRDKFLIRFTDLQDIFKKILPDWFLLKGKINAGINILIELFMYRNSPIELRFLSIMQAAEHIHRELINGQKMSLQIRLEEVIARLPVDIKDALLSDTVKFITAIKVNRNYLTHYDEKLAKLAAKLEDVHLLSEKMKIILWVIIFQELKIPEKEIVNIIFKNGMWLFHHLLKIKKDDSPSQA